MITRCLELRSCLVISEFGKPRLQSCQDFWRARLTSEQKCSVPLLFDDTAVRRKKSEQDGRVYAQVYMLNSFDFMGSHRLREKSRYYNPYLRLRHYNHCFRSKSMCTIPPWATTHQQLPAPYARATVQSKRQSQPRSVIYGAKKHATSRFAPSTFPPPVSEQTASSHYHRTLA